MYSTSNEYCTLYITECIIIFWARLNFIWGGACTLYSTECFIIFCSAQFYLGGLKAPPSPNDAPPLTVTNTQTFYSLDELMNE